MYFNILEVKSLQFNAQSHCNYKLTSNPKIYMKV